MRGAALVEMALATPVFALLLFGAIDFGINWQSRIQTAHAARELARSASVARMGEDTSCSPVGLTPSSELLRETVCLARSKVGRGADDVRVKVIYMGPLGRRATDVANSRNSVVVCVMTRARSATLITAPFFDGRFYESRAVTKTAKPYGGAPVPEGEETPLPGASWTFCRTDVAGSE